MIKKILLAEDDRGTALLVKTQLERKGFSVQIAENGRQALAFLTDIKYDLLITDVVMPEMDGVDLYMELQKSPEGKSLPVIIVTDKTVFKDSFAALGVGHFVPKTSDISLLLDKISEIQNTQPAPRMLRKVLIAGNSSVVTTQMKDLLRDAGCLASVAVTSAETVSQAFTMSPHVLFIDILMKDTASTLEVVMALKCFQFLKGTAILTYTSLSAAEIGQLPGALEVAEEEIAACKDAGCRYIGRFNRLMFPETMKELGIK